MWKSVSVTGNALPEQIQGYEVTTNFFELCGVEPILGRTFTESEAQPGQDGEVILSYRLWQRRFNGDRAAIGQTVHLDQQVYTVIGIMPEWFRFPTGGELWIPLAIQPSQRTLRTWHALYVLGKLNPGITAERANVDMDTIAQRLGESYPNSNRGWGVQVMPIRRFAIGDNAYQYTYLLLGAVVFVLLIVCANVGNLQFVRGAKRVKEVAIRTAMGGSRWRIVRQLLTESTRLALAGAALGVLLAQWTVHLMIAGMPQDVARGIAGFDEIRVDARALGFTIAVAIAAGLIAGLSPALESTRVRLSEVLKEGGRGGTTGRVRQRLRGALVIIQVALAVVLLAGAGLIVRGFRAIQNADSRYRPESLLTMVLNLPDNRYGQQLPRAEFIDQAVTRLAGLPGAKGAAETTIIPHTIGNSNQDFAMQGRPWTNVGEARTADLEIVSPNYFRVMGVPILEGREFTDGDATETAQVAMISQSMARAYWPKESPIGHGIKFGHYESKYPWATIVGVVADVKMDWSDLSPSLAVYRPYKQISRTYVSFVVRSGGSAEGLVSEARGAIAEVDPEIALLTLKPMKEVINNSLFTISYAAAMMGALGILALALAALGVYGVLAYSVAESTNEIGIRMALGALPGDVMRLVLRRGMGLAVAGLAMGIPIAYSLARVLAGLTPGIGKPDPLTLVEIAAVLLAAALLACWLPARRATRTDPITALRYE
jgi:putative ABC transport system permease protein